MEKIYNWNGIQCYYDQQDRLVHAHTKHVFSFDIDYDVNYTDGKGVVASMDIGEYGYISTSYYQDGTAYKYAVAWGDDSFWEGANLEPRVIKYGEEVTYETLCDIADPEDMDLEYYA